MGLRLHHVALRVADPERSLLFYGGLLGLAELRRFEDGGRVRSIWLDAGPAVLMLEREIKGGGPPAGSGHVLAFAIDDLAAWEGRLRAGGVGVLDRTAATVFVADPDGHRVGLSVYVFPVTRPAKPFGEGEHDA